MNYKLNLDSGFICVACSEPIIEADLEKSDESYFHRDCLRG